MIVTFAALAVICFICYHIGYCSRRNSDNYHLNEIIRILYDSRGKTNCDDRLISQAIRVATNCRDN